MGSHSISHRLRASGRVPSQIHGSLPVGCSALKGRRGSLRDSDVARRFGTRPAFHHSMNYRSVIVFGQATPGRSTKIGGTKAAEHVMRSLGGSASAESTRVEHWFWHCPHGSLSQDAIQVPVDDEADYELPCPGELPRIDESWSLLPIRATQTSRCPLTFRTHAANVR